MLLCCDVINLVKKAARDIKIKRSLSRKRSETSRTATSIGRYSVMKNGQEKSDFQYERDSVNKVARIHKVDGSLRDEGEVSRSFRKSAKVEDARLRSTSSLNRKMNMA